MSAPLVIQYHGIVPEIRGLQYADLGVLPESSFEDHLRLLRRRFDFLHPRDYLEYLRAGRFPKRTALLTIDDGFQNALTHALPVAESLGIPFVLFVADSHLDAGEWLWFSRAAALCQRQTRRPIDLLASLAALPLEQIHGRLEELSAPRRLNGLPEEHVLFDGADSSQLRVAVSTGLLTVGGHTSGHPNLTVESSADGEAEIRRNKETLERAVGCQVEFFAYPGAYLNESIARRVRDCGYRCAFAVNPHPSIAADLRPFALPRVGIYRPGLLRMAAKVLLRTRAYES